MEALISFLIEGGAAMKEIIVCAQNLANAQYNASCQKIMRKKEKNLEAELQAFKVALKNNNFGKDFKRNFEQLNDKELLTLASKLIITMVAPEIKALNRNV